MSERSEREIRESIETTRARMGETIEQIGDRVNPSRVKSELKARARDQIHEATDNVKRKARNTMRDVEHGVSDTGRGIWATIRENPVPAGMVGVGLAWLIANRRDAGEHPDHEYGTYSTGPAVPYRSGYSGSRYPDTTGRGSAASYGSAGDYAAAGDYGSAGEYGATGSIGATTGGYGATGSTGSTAGYGSAGSVGSTGRDRNFESRGDARATGVAGAGSAQWRDEEEGSEGIRDKASDVMHEAGERIEGARERVGSAVHEAQERVGEVVHETRDRASSWAHEAKYRAQRAEHRMEDSLRENPMAAGAMALAIGVAAGLMIPESEREHRLMGRARERAFDRTRDTVRRSAEKLHDAARDAAGESARQAVDEIWPGGDEQQNEGFSEPRR